MFSEIINTQFEVIAKRFEDFESIMDNNEYTEVDKILNIIDELLNHMPVFFSNIATHKNNIFLYEHHYQKNRLFLRFSYFILYDK